MAYQIQFEVSSTHLIIFFMATVVTFLTSLFCLVGVYLDRRASAKSTGETKYLLSGQHILRRSSSKTLGFASSQNSNPRRYTNSPSTDTLERVASGASNIMDDEEKQQQQEANLVNTRSQSFTRRGTDIYY